MKLPALLVLLITAFASAAPISPAIPLAPLIAAAKGPLKLNAGGHYSLPASAINVKYSIDGSGSTIDLPQGTTNFKAVAANVTISNFVVPKSGLFFEAAADHCGVENCKIGVGQPSGSVEQAFKTVPGGTNPFFSNNSVGVTTTVSVYIDQSGAWIANNALAGSTKEYALRFDVGGPDGKTTERNATVIGNSISNTNGCKDAVGIRQYLAVNFCNNTVVGDIRWGQVPGTGTPATKTVGQYASGTMSGNHFASNGMAISLCEVYQGVEISGFTANVFTDPLAPPLSADTFSQVNGGANVEQCYTGAKAWEFFAASSKGKYVNQSPDKTAVAPAPAK